MCKNKKDFSNVYIQPEENGAALYQGIDRIFRRNRRELSMELPFQSRWFTVSFGSDGSTAFTCLSLLHLRIRWSNIPAAFLRFFS